MASLKQLKKTVNFLKKSEFRNIAYNNLYPTPHELIRLGSITELRKNFKKM